MTIARQIADMIDAGGDVKSGVLDNVPPSDWDTLLNRPDHANTDTRIGSNITSGTIPAARLGSGSPASGNYLRGDGTWQTNCTNHGNCSNCYGTGTGTYSGTACSGTLITASGSASSSYGGTLTYSGSHIALTAGACACVCACACNC